MSRTLLINATEPEERRAALVEDGRLIEFMAERKASVTLVGNLYRGRVVNLETGIGAAFVDIGVGRNAFLHVSDCLGAVEDGRIDEHASLGQELLVQVTRDSIGSKGPVLTANVSLPGRFVVLLPFAAAGGVSRRIDDAGDKSRLRALTRSLEGELGSAVILRTAAAERDTEEVLHDGRRLAQLWRAVNERAGRGSGPRLLFAEDLIARAVRDLVDDQVEEIIVDAPEALDRAEETVAAVQPALKERLRLHEDAMPLFHDCGIEEEVDRLVARRVPLPGGGSIVFDSTEALIAVDVNSGRTRTEEGLEETALQTNLEAAVEIARQLRLRDLGGVIAVDFIDQKEPEHVRAVDSAFRAELARDRAHLRPDRLGAFGTFVLTRRRAGDGTLVASRTCPRCGGRGEVLRPETIAVRVWRELLARAAAGGLAPLVVRLGAEVAEALQALRGSALTALAEEAGREVRIEADAALAAEEWRIDATP
jgi:ribonuclease E